MTYLILGISILIYAITFRYTGEIALSPMLLPTLSSVVIIVSSLFLLRQKSYKINIRKLKKSFIMLIVTLLYVTLLGKINFIVLNVFLLSSLMYILGERKIKSIFIYSATISVVVYFVFIKILGVMLP